MRVHRGVISYSPRPLCVCRQYNGCFLCRHHNGSLGPLNDKVISILAAWVQKESLSPPPPAAATTTTIIIVEGARRGTRHLYAAEPRRRGGWEREGVSHGKRQKRYAAARGDPDASPTPDKAQARHINTCVPLPPVACPQPHVPQGFLMQQAQWQLRSTREGRAHKGRGERGLSGGRKKGMMRRAATRTRAPPTCLPLGDP